MLRQRWFIVLLCSWSCAALAGDRSDLLAQLAIAPNANELLQQVKDESRAAYDRALHQYDELIKARPFDVLLQIERCRFIRRSAGSDEDENFSEEIYRQGEDCDAEIESKFGDHPEADLYKLEGMYGEEAYKAALVLKDAADRWWTDGQRARLYVVLANTGREQHASEANQYAVTALEEDSAADVRLMAARYWKDRGALDQAVEVLVSPLDEHDPNDAWYLTQKLQLLAELNAASAVREVYGSLRKLPNYSHLQVAKTLLNIGAFDEARNELAQKSIASREPEVAWTRFKLELQSGTAKQAAAAYDKLRDLGFKQDPLGINRAALFFKNPSVGFQPRDLLALLALLATLAGLGVALLLPLSFVHYRGLARQVAGKSTLSAAHWRQSAPRGWDLRHAWLVLFAFVGASIFAMYAAGPVRSMGPSGKLTFDLGSEQLARASLVEMFIALFSMCVIVAWRGRFAIAHLNARWTPARSVAIAVTWVVILRLPILFVALSGRLQSNLPSVQVELWNVLQSVSVQHGKLAALWMMVLAAPVIEEFVFRGVLLAAVSKHITFRWANAFQAGLFAAAHLDARAFAFLFVLGLLFGWIRQRSGTLWVPMFSHGLFNLIGGLVLLH